MKQAICLSNMENFLRRTQPMPICPEMSVIHGIVGYWQNVAEQNQSHNYYKISLETVRSKDRQRYIAYARFFISYYLVDICAWSLPLAGYFMGCRDHSTVIHHRNELKNQVFSKHDNEIKDAFNVLTSIMKRPEVKEYDIDIFLNKFGQSREGFSKFRLRTGKSLAAIKSKISVHQKRLTELQQKLREAAKDEAA
jgi:Bacterial dnaA protein helix-turn-helix